MEQTKRLYRIVDMCTEIPRVWTIDEAGVSVEHTVPACGYEPYPGCPGGVIKDLYTCLCSCHKKAR